MKTGILLAMIALGFSSPSPCLAATAMTNVDNNWSVPQTFQSSITVKSTMGSIIPVGGNAPGLSITQNDTTNNPNAVTIVSTGTGNAINITANGNAGNNDQGSGSIYMNCTGNLGGFCLNMYSNASFNQGVGSMLRVHQANPLYQEPLVIFESDSTLFPASNLMLRGGIPSLYFWDNTRAAPYGQYQISSHNDNWRFEGRNAANSAFDSVYQVFRPTAVPNILFGAGYQSPHNAQFEIFANSYLQPTDFIVAVDSQDFLVGDVFSILANGSVGLQRSVPYTTSVLEVGPNQASFAVTNYGHFRLRGSAPSVSCSAGTATTASYAMDHAGRFTLSGGSPANCTVTFNQSFDQPPSCWCNDETQAVICQTKSPTTSSIVFNSTSTFGSSDTISYGCLDAW